MKLTKLTASVVLIGLLAACGGSDSAPSATSGAATTIEGADTTTPDNSGAPADSGDGSAGTGDLDACAAGKTITDGTLTVATGDPAYPPYVIDDQPDNGKGLESAVAYAIADQLGFTKDHVTWVRTTFDEAIQPGPKSFDFNVQQYSITPEREQTIGFSSPYYTSTQAILGLDGSAAMGKAKISELKSVKFGVMAGTTSKEFVDTIITPDQDVLVYDDNAAAKAALEGNQVDAIVLDLPTALYVSAAEITDAKVIGQFPVDATSNAEQWGAVFEKDNPLIECVDQALAALTESGELDAITNEWMSTDVNVPVLSNG